MEKIFVAAGLVIGLMSWGSESSEVESTSHSSMVMDANAAPMGDTANQINSSAGNFPNDTSNRNGDDSVSGSSPQSRSTTPGNESGNKGRKQ